MRAFVRRPQSPQRRSELVTESDSTAVGGLSSQPHESRSGHDDAAVRLTHAEQPREAREKSAWMLGGIPNAWTPPAAAMRAGHRDAVAS